MTKKYRNITYIDHKIRENAIYMFILNEIITREPIQNNSNHKFTGEIKTHELEEQADYNMPEKSENTNINACRFLKQKN